MVRPIHRLVSQADQHSRDCRAFSQTKVLYQNLHIQLCSDIERGRRALEYSPLVEGTSDLAQGEHIYSNFTLKDAGFWQGSNKMPWHKTYRLCSQASTGLHASNQPITLNSTSKVPYLMLYFCRPKTLHGWCGKYNNSTFTFLNIFELPIPNRMTLNYVYLLVTKWYCFPWSTFW